MNGESCPIRKVSTTITQQKISGNDNFCHQCFLHKTDTDIC